MNYIGIWKIIIGYFIFCLYHYYTSETSFLYHDTEQNKKIINLSKIFREGKYKFKPYFLLPTGLLQMIFFRFLAAPPAELEITREDVNNSGVYLDWVDYHPIIKNKLLSTVGESSENIKPILLLLPGLTGGKQDKYILNVSYEGLKNNYNVVIYQNRMLSENIVLPENSHVNLFEDLDLAIDKIQTKFPYCKIFAIGFSYGANKLLYYLGTKNLTKKRIFGAVSVSNPYDLLICQRMLSETIFDHFILKLLKNNLHKNFHVLSKPYEFFNLDVEKARKANNVKEFDEGIVRRVLGFKTADDYYRGISCVHKLEKIDVPLLCISSIDDDITSSKAIPYDEVSLNKNIMLLVTDKGGHLCYLGNESLFKLKYWVAGPVIEFINSVKTICN